ncbi:hypothetical protein P2Q00_35415 [Streptomyces coacervatus]|nr:hypothetical protein [Streptomyces coacervatus]MDF2270677.1 hypothetical protein [Streptomyces coacervatus]
MGFAEAATFDARGQLALIGFSPQAFTVEQFPGQVNAPLIMIIDDDDEGATLKAGRTANVRIMVKNDSGEVVFFVEQATPVNEVKNSGMLPGRLALVAQVPVTASKAGRYTYHATVTVVGDDSPELTAQASLRVVDQALLDARRAAAQQNREGQVG